MKTKILYGILVPLLLTSTSIAAPLLKFTPPGPGEYRLQGRSGTKPFFYLSNPRDELAFPDFSIQIDKDHKNKNAFPFDKVEADISFYSLSSEGSSLKSELKIQSPEFQNILLSKNSLVRVRQEWKLANCDGQSVAPTGKSGISAIESIRRLDFTRYMNCNLSAKSTSCSETDAQFWCATDQSKTVLSFKDDGSIVRSGDFPGFAYSYFAERYIPTKQFNPKTQEHIMKATEDFVDLLKIYGHLVIRTKGMQATDRDTALRSWLTKNQEALLRLLNYIEKYLPETTTLTKLNVVSSINNAYETILSAEREVNASTSLDEVVRMR